MLSGSEAGLEVSPSGQVEPAAGRPAIRTAPSSLVYGGERRAGGAAGRAPALVPGLFDRGFRGLFRAPFGLISWTGRSLPEAELSALDRSPDAGSGPIARRRLWTDRPTPALVEAGRMAGRREGRSASRNRP